MVRRDAHTVWRRSSSGRDSRMTRQFMVGLAGALGAVAISAAPAAASGLVCAKTASVRAGTVLDLGASGGLDASGHRHLDQTAVHHARRGTYYVTTSPVVLRFGGFVFTVADDSIFDIGCSGQAGGPARLPSLNV